MNKLMAAVASPFVKSALANFKTTLIGVTMVLHGLWLGVEHLRDITENGGALSLETLGIAKLEIMGGVGFIMARDGDKSSKAIGLE